MWVHSLWQTPVYMCTYLYLYVYISCIGCLSWRTLANTDIQLFIFWLKLFIYFINTSMYYISGMHTIGIILTSFIKSKLAAVRDSGKRASKVGMRNVSYIKNLNWSWLSFLPAQLLLNWLLVFLLTLHLLVIISGTSDPAQYSFSINLWILTTLNKN